MKKLLSILLCLSMMSAFVTVRAEEKTDNTDALDMFGFNLDSDSYDTNAIKPGTYPVSPKYDLYVDNYSNIQKYKWDKTVGNITAWSDIYKESTYTNKENVPYSAVTGFSASGTGVEDHIAKVYFPYGKSGANIRLSIYDAEGNAIVTGYETGGYVRTTDTIEMWEVEGLLSITSGDFDGDGIDEIAVYTPNNADKNKPTNVSVGIFEFDKKTKTLTTKHYIDLSSKSAGEICEWEYSNDHDVVQFYCLPYVALSANDLSRDGIDDLSAIVNFSTWFRGTESTRTYTTAQILNHNTHFASVLESYEGIKGGNLKQVIKHRVLATTPLTGGSSSKPNDEHRYILRNANLTVGDVTQEGSQEIIIAGNYTRVDVKNTSDNKTKVGANRMVEVDGNHALCHIVGYTSYENLKNHNTYDLNSDYKWTVQRNGNDWTYWYNEDETDSGPITTSLCAFKQKGTGKPDTIFVGGQLFDYSADEGKLKFSSNYNGPGQLYHGSNGKKRETSVVWIGGSVAGNFTDDKFGREILVFPFYLKVSGKEQYTCKLLTLSEQTSALSNGGSSAQDFDKHYLFEDVSTQRLASFALLDGGGKTSYITYPGNDTEVYYSDVEVLSIMQAPPLYEEIDDDDYIGNSATSFAKSESTGTGTTNGGSFSIGPVIGMEYNAKFLGIIPCGGVEYEFSLTGSVSHEKSTEKTYTYATGFETSGTTDAVTVFTVPYVRYNCQIYMPEYKMPTESDYNTLCAFRDELTTNLEKCLNTGEEQITGEYVKGCKYYEFKYSSYVSSDNYQEQLNVLKKVSEEIKFIEDGIESFGKGGTGKWGEVVEGSISPYTYSVPQTPMMTTVDVATYDSIAEFTPGLEKIYGNVFPENYRAGDPNTYAKKDTELPADGKVIQAKMSDSQTEGFLTNSSASAAGVAQSQTISVEESESSSIGWGIAIENTSLAIASVVKVGFTASLEHSTSYVTTTTKGHEYSGTVVTFPENTPFDYAYDWKLVSYNAKLNGTKVPVVGYLTRINTTPPSSVAQNINVDEITDTSATITWEQGDRKASYFKLFRKQTVLGKEEELEIADNIKSDENGNCSYTLTGLKPLSEYSYVIRSYDSRNKESVASEKITVATLPKGFTTSLSVNGINSDVVYQKDVPITLNSSVTGNEGYETYYQWQIDKGNGWEKVDGWNKKNLSFNTSPLLNGYRIRCTTIVAIDDKVSYVVYSDPMTIRCATQCENYSVDWDSDRKKVNVNLTENAKDSDIMIAVYDGNVLKACITGDYEDNEIDISEYADKGYTIRAFVWNNSLQPMGYVFERKDSPNYKVHWDMDNDSVRVELAENAKDSDIFIAAYENNAMKSCITGDYENNEFDISEYVKNDYIIKIFVWDENQKPMGSVYEK